MKVSMKSYAMNPRVMTTWMKSKPFISARSEDKCKVTIMLFHLKGEAHISIHITKVNFPLGQSTRVDIIPEELKNILTTF